MKFKYSGDEKLDRAREFCLEVVELADMYGLPFFFVTDGASATRNNGCDAVKHARKHRLSGRKRMVLIQMRIG